MPALPSAKVERFIAGYYQRLAEVRGQGATKESSLRAAFEDLLYEAGREVGWVVIPEESLPNRKRPDATLRDANTLPRGWWEAKDSGDDLEVEIQKKLALGYPATNIIFEDGIRAILLQNKQRVMQIDLADRKALADLLQAFFGHTEPAFESFAQAVTEFRERIPDLAAGLRAKIEQERKEKNTDFVKAYVKFKEVCRQAIDPDIRDEQIDEMLVQHLLTERLFRTVFDNPDFTRRNVIAAELETVIDALTSRAFNRREFQAGLDRFYVASRARRGK